MSDVKKERAWKRFFDAENQAYYWYNQQTGQSRWEEEDFDAQQDHQGMESNPLLTADPHHASSSHYDEGRPPAPTPLKDIEPNVSSASTAGSKAKDVEKKNKKKKTKQRILPFNESVGSVEVGRDEIDESEADYDLLCYGRFAKVNAFLFESPFCVIEAGLRIVVLVVIFAAFLVYSLVVVRKWDKYSWTVSKRVLRDATLTAAAALSLLVPGLILYVYGSYKSLNPWKLRHIPTVLGPVDPRRFVVISVFGMGSMAANASVDLSDVHRDSLDKWSDACLYYPRNVVEELRRFVNGRKNLESIEVALAAPDP